MKNSNMHHGKRLIIELFRKNVKGKKSNVDNKNWKHDGKEGHWLEKQFLISLNSNNNPDILGYEMKNDTKQITSFGDWIANQYIFNSKVFSHIFTGKTKNQRRNLFLKFFGKQNLKKEGRYSWSGDSCPKIDKYNNFGQKLIIEEKTNDIVVIYNFNEDKRENKTKIIPTILQINYLELARWYGKCYKNIANSKPISKTLKEKVEDKYNQLGWFVCKKNQDGLYDKIAFGNPLNFANWISLVKKGVIYFDSGMNNQNPRNYSHWRASNSLWKSLIVEEYE